MFRIKFSSLWFWGILITFELLLISIVGYGLTSYQAYNLVVSQLQLDSTRLIKGQPNISSEYLVINSSGQIQQGSTQLRTKLPIELSKPVSMPSKSVVFDDLYAYRLEDLNNSSNYLVTYQPYKKNNPWPEQIIIAAIILVGVSLFLIFISQLLNGNRTGKFAIS